MPYPVPARQPAPQPAPSQPIVPHGEMFAAVLLVALWAVALVAILTH